MLNVVENFVVAQSHSIIDSYLRFARQAAAVAKVCNYHIHALRHVRKLLTDETARTVACSIAARLDYCNAVLYAPRRRR